MSKRLFELTQCTQAHFSAHWYRALGLLPAKNFIAVLAVGWLALYALPASAHFNDDFARTDSTTIGNGWIEKSATAFSVAGGEVTKVSAGASDYRNNIVYRPANEDSLDQEAAVEFRLTTLPAGYPQLMVRVQSATAATNNTLDAYLLYLNDSATQAVLSRQRGSSFDTPLATLAISPALNTTDRYRLRLRATGSATVQLGAYIERLNGSTWVTVGQALFSDATASRIATAGSVGFGGYVETNYRYDNFTRVDLGATGTANPLPSTTGLAPSTASAGENGLTLVVYGNGFTSDSVVRWNGSSRPTIYVSPSELEATISASDLASPGSFGITVFNPTPGGGISAGQAFQVTPSAGPPPPTIASLSPSSATAGGAAFTITVNGSNFASDSVVRWNGSARPTSFGSAAQLTATIAAVDISTAGTAAVTVFRPTDGLASAAQSFSINVPPAPGSFTDLFDRANSDSIGNGWIEKSASAFSIAANEVSKVGPGASDYRNNIVYRPAVEDLLDVEASMELRFLSLPVGYPQVTVRMQSGTVGTTNALDAYLLYVSDSTSQAVLARQRGTSFDTPLATLTISPALNTTDRYRLRLRATGTTAVQLNAYVERLNGSSWQIIGQAAFSDTAANRINTSGSVGFGGYVETNYRYDNFTRTDLGAPNPIPAIATLSPASASAGSGPVSVTVSGSGFVPGSVARWNGSDRSTSIQSASLLSVQLTTADLASAGAGTVTVFNPSPAGGTSGGLTFTVSAPPSNPVPTLTTLSPNSVTAGSGALTLTVTGSSFVAGSVVRWNGVNRATTFVSPTQLQAAISASDVSGAGSASVTVFSPTPGGGISNAITFQISAANNPLPVLGSLSPSSANAGSGALVLTLSGSSFVAGSVVRWNGSDRLTTFVSPTQLLAQIQAADIVTAGTASIGVFSPGPGGGTSASLLFQINAANNPLPTVSTLSPTSATAGGPDFTLAVSGSGFVANSVVRWAGSNRATTYVSSTQLQAQIAASDISTTGARSITVFSPNPGGGTSNAISFNVVTGTNPAPVLNSLSPTTAVPGGGGFTLTAQGTGFVTGSTILWNGLPRPTTFVSSTALQASISASDVATAGIPAVTVSTPAPGGGVTDPLTFFVQPASIGYFFDGFNRPDNAAIGNGWTEKSPAAFTLQGGEIVSIRNDQEFMQNVVSRPASEDRLNVDTAIEFVRLPNTPNILDANFPQLHARIQQDTVSLTNTLTSYIFFIDELSVEPRAMFAISSSPSPGVRFECYIAPLPLSQPLTAGQRYRLRLSVSGQSPVRLWGSVDQFTNGQWVNLGSNETTHSVTSVLDPGLFCDQTALPAPITSAGSAGFSKWLNRSDVYDNFYWRDTASPSSLMSLAPSALAIGATARTIIVSGSGFTTASVGRWNNASRPTTFVSATQLQVELSASDVAQEGLGTISVFDSAEGVTSNGLVLEVVPGSPVVTFLDSFQRSDGAAIGNNWVEKNAAAFSLVGGRAQKLANGDYRNNLVYRPPAENTSDAEVSAEFRLSSLPVGYPQVMTRLLSATAGTASAFDGYLMYMGDSPATAIISRQRVGVEWDTPLRTISLTQLVNTTDTYRLRLRATGTNPVRLTGFIERQSGTTWEVIGYGVVDDASASRISSPGSAGFAGDTEGNYSFDNFRVIQFSP